MTTLKLGTRGSQLALCQSRMVAALVARAGVEIEEVVIKTSGDRIADAPLAQIGGKRLFVKEIEDALLAGEIDLAVHSAKDMPAVIPDGLAIAAILPREDPRDAIVTASRARSLPAEPRALMAALGRSSAAASSIGDATSGPLIGTGSVRRVAQLAPLWPSARFARVRGNLDTRLKKLDAGDYDALVLAVAGLRRLGFAHRISAALPIDLCVPAPGQGAIAVEIRADDARARALLASIDDETTAAAVAAERALVAALGGGCQAPIGAAAVPRDRELELHAMVASLDGARAIRRRGRGDLADPAALGARVARELVDAGAVPILDEARRAQAAVQGIQP